ncbi:MAG: alpha/beta hydrolase [Polaribacter sp.]|nr:alpha/beta hydrolase [Polaribacter sp.]
MRTKLTFLFALVFLVTFGQSSIVSEEILIHNNTIELPGTLSYVNQNSALIIWVHGSGNIDRNGNQGSLIKANYIKQFRDSINKKGIAFFSFDKRTANPNNIKLLKNTLFDDLVRDTQKVIAHFKADNRFSEIILIGHSQGSLIAMLASEKIDSYISLAGPAESIDKTLIQQISKQAPLLGDIAKAHIKELKETGAIKDVNPMLLSLFNKSNQPFLANWMLYNPSEEIKKLTIPILIINGTKDIQVKEEDANILHKANEKSTLAIIKNMNHVLKNIAVDADNMKSYYSADYALSKQLITTIVAFINN